MAVKDRNNDQFVGHRDYENIATYETGPPPATTIGVRHLWIEKRFQNVVGIDVALKSADLRVARGTPTGAEDFVVFGSGHGTTIEQSEQSEQ